MAIVIDAFGSLKKELEEKNVQSVPQELLTLGPKSWEDASRASGARVVPEEKALELLLGAQRAAAWAGGEGGHPGDGGGPGGADVAGRARVLPVRFGDSKRVYIRQEELERLLIPEVAEATRLREAADRGTDGSLTRAILQKARPSLFFPSRAPQAPPLGPTPRRHLA